MHVQEKQDKQMNHDNNKTVYNQGKMDGRTDKKLEAMAKDKLSKDSEKQMKKA